METATLKPYKITKGGTYKEVFTLNFNGEPLDLTAYTGIKMDIRKGEDESAELLHSVSLGDGIEVSGENNNILTITISKTITKEWERDQYYRDIAFTDAEGTYYFLEGIVAVRKNITDNG